MAFKSLLCGAFVLRLCSSLLCHLLKVLYRLQGGHRLVKVIADRVFRGKYWGQEDIGSVSYKPDFQLIPKSEEGRVSGTTSKELPPGVTADIIMPAYTTFPPLLRVSSTSTN